MGSTGLVRCMGPHRGRAPRRAAADQTRRPAAGRRRPAGGAGLLFGDADGAFGHDVQVAQVPGVLLEQVEQDSFQGGRVGAVPALAGLAHVVQVVGLDDGPGPPGLIQQVSQQGGQGLVRADMPPAALGVGPRIVDVAALEAPLEPAQLDVAQVLGQLERRPAGRQPAALQLGGGQGLELVGQPGPEVVQVAEEDLGARTRRRGGLGKRLGNADPSLDGACLDGPFLDCPSWTAGRQAIIPRSAPRARARRSG
jgi:hypothetical protein